MSTRIAPGASLIAGLGGLCCILLAAGALVLTRIAFKMIGVPTILTEADAAHIAAMGQVWGLYLAAEIVKHVLALAFVATAWATWFALPGASRLRTLALALATIGGAAMAVGFRFGINATERLAEGLAPGDTLLANTLVTTGIATAGIAIALTAVAGARERALPEWMQGLGYAIAALGLGTLVYPLAAGGFAVAMLVWWLAMLPPLFANDTRAIAR